MCPVKTRNKSETEITDFINSRGLIFLSVNMRYGTTTRNPLKMKENSHDGVKILYSAGGWVQEFPEFSQISVSWIILHLHFKRSGQALWWMSRMAHTFCFAFFHVRKKQKIGISTNNLQNLEVTTVFLLSRLWKLNIRKKTLNFHFY